ncbi:MAG: 3-oxoacyl-[acyl-carrier-protein] synthase 2 [marine bacterium B5-7]|nr:MAG: 3-oxoacyl-[acyl-carrier-protein] synthase 2 [marine bacterium B5-7]
MKQRKVVVTGLGMLSPIGHSVEESWQNALAGKSGIHKVEAFDASAFSSQIWGTVKNFDGGEYVSPKERKKFAEFVQYGMHAAGQAVADAGLKSGSLDYSRVGVAIGSGIGGLNAIENAHLAWQKGGPRRIPPSFIPGAIINMISGIVSIQHGFTGPNFSIVTACTTGTHNIGYSARSIAWGDADVMVCGGAEMASTVLGLGGFAAMRALSTRNDEPEKASRPWDKDRDGFVLGEGAGVLVLESEEHAKARGARIYAELAGFGVSGDAHHITLPDPECKGWNTCITNAMRDAEVNPEDIDYVNAHATSTPAGDELEAKGITTAFGEENAKGLLVSATKSMTGHLLGATGAVEAIFSILAIRDNIVPPTINLDNPIDTVLDLVPHKAREAEIKTVMSNSFGFGGTNGTLIFKEI